MNQSNLGVRKGLFGLYILITGKLGKNATRELKAELKAEAMENACLMAYSRGLPCLLSLFLERVSPRQFRLELNIYPRLHLNDGHK